MNLYRIDTPNGPISDILGPCLIRNASNARQRARSAAATLGVPAALTRISGAGMLRHMGTYYPDGTFDRFGHTY